MDRVRLISVTSTLAALCAMSVALSGCSQIVDFSQCESDSECASGRVCDQGLCVAPQGCTERASCVERLGDQAYCLAGACRTIDASRCGSLGQVFSSENADGVIVPVGALMPLSGANQSKGVATRDGAELALRQINSSGGLQGARLGLITCDTQYEPARAVELANYLHDELGVDAMVGAISSAETLSLVDQSVDDKGILLISPASTTPGLSLRSDNFWRTIPSDALQAPAMGQLLRAREAEQVVVLYGGPDDPYGSGFFEALNFYWGGLPAGQKPTVRAVSFDRAAPLAEVDRIGREIMGSGTPPDAIVLIGPSRAIDLLAALEQGAVGSAADTPIWVLPEALRDQVLLQTEGAEGAFDRIIGTAPIREQTAIYFTFDSFYQSSFGLDPSSTQFADKAYDAAFLIGAALGAQPDPLQTTGSDLSQTLELIVPAKAASASYQAIGRDFTQIAGALSEGTKIAITGVSSELNFDANHDPADVTIGAWSIKGSPPMFFDEPLPEPAQ